MKLRAWLGIFEINWARSHSTELVDNIYMFNNNGILNHNEIWQLIHNIVTQ